MKKQQSQIDALDRKIEAIIAEEARKAAERARAEAEAEARRLAEQKAKEQGLPQNGAEKPKETKPDTKPTIPEGYKMPRADRELSGSFAKNKGKLPFPVAGHYRIVGHFGLHKHPEFKYLDKNNLGIDIETLPGTKADTSLEVTFCRKGNAFGPFTQNSPMWDTSNTPTAWHTVKCSSMMPEYSIGIL